MFNHMNIWDFGNILCPKIWNIFSYAYHKHTINSAKLMYVSELIGRWRSAWCEYK
jgi:hypothetical protein